MAYHIISYAVYSILYYASDDVARQVTTGKASITGARLMIRLDGDRGYYPGTTPDCN